MEKHIRILLMCIRGSGIIGWTLFFLVGPALKLWAEGPQERSYGCPHILQLWIARYSLFYFAYASVYIEYRC